MAHIREPWKAASAVHPALLAVSSGSRRGYRSGQYQERVRKPSSLSPHPIQKTTKTYPEGGKSGGNWLQVTWSEGPTCEPWAIEITPHLLYAVTTSTALSTVCCFSPRLREACGNGRWALEWEGVYLPRSLLQVTPTA